MNHARRGIARPRVLHALSFLFALALAGFAPAPAHAASGTIGPPILGLHWETIPPTPCVGETVSLRFTMCDCHYDLLGAAIVPDRGLSVAVGLDTSLVCVTCDPDTAEVVIGAMQVAGTHLRSVRIVLPPEYADSLSGIDDYITFPVAPTCNPPGTIPYLDRVVIGRPAPCAGCPSSACPGDSIDVLLGGWLPNECYQVSNIALHPSMTLGPLPQPPTIRITYGTNSCIERPCSAFPLAWAERVRIPGLPALGGVVYQLPIDGYLLDFCTQDSVGTYLASAQFPFTVADSCSTATPPADRCYNVRWEEERSVQTQEAGDAPLPPARCTASWKPGGSTRLVFGVGSQATISGVQGTLRIVEPGALSLGEVRVLWPGWELGRTQEADGAVRFIAFAGPDADPFPAHPTGSPVAFLSVEVKHDATLRVVTPDVVHLVAHDLIVSDDAGQGLRACPTPAVFPGPNVAIVCRRARCDANADGNADVRDLVVMVNCLAPPENATRTCPVDSLGGALDCDGDAGFDLDDVFCCVRAMLGGDAPRDSTGMREAPEIAVRFGVPQPAEDGTIAVPLFLGGMSIVAAARLDVAYPDARYELVDVTFVDPPASWWTLHEGSAGHARLAILDLGALGGQEDLGSVRLHPGDPRAILRFRLRDGATAGGELAVASSDFAAADGVGLRTPNASPRVALAGGTGMALSAARPNPFGGATNIALTLPVAGAVDVAVFAASGRRVATLLREGAAPAGVYDLAWDGRMDAGGRASAGVYFVRVVTGPADASRKVLYLPGGAP